MTGPEMVYFGKVLYVVEENVCAVVRYILALYPLGTVVLGTCFLVVLQFLHCGVQTQ